eukprot:TRINITY_DN1166_c0_g1_i4.p1 TRINITY_DN1166_c0_g1~~TRINITY_DN1166_c0_g1_i4.p1  ORF type:complete len:643 (-),score=180.51 TRINITY_DN1166_c0_g1_i4:144-2072(-)
MNANKNQRKTSQTSSEKVSESSSTAKDEAESTALDKIRSIKQMIKDDDVKSFRLLLKKGTIRFCDESLYYLSHASECRAHLQQQLARQNHCSYLEICGEEDWENLTKDIVGLIKELQLIIRVGYDPAKYDVLLDCSRLQTVSLNLDPISEAIASAAALLKTMSLLPSLKSLSFDCSLFKFADTQSLFALCSSLNFRHLESLSFTGPIDWSLLFSFIRNACPTISSLTLCGHYEDEEEQMAPPTAEQMRVLASSPLRSLELDHCEISDENCATLLLYSFHSSSSSASTASSSSSVSSSSSSPLSSHLESLDVQQNSALSSAGIVSLASAFPFLIELDLTDTAFDSSAAQALLDHLPRLERLVLCQCEGITDECVIILSKIHSLMQLDLSVIDNLSSAICAPLASMPNLLSLNLDGARGFLADLAKSRSLRELSLVSPSIDNDDLTVLSKSNHSLTSLKTDSKRITDKGVMALMDCSSSSSSSSPSFASHLSSLDIRATRLTDSSLVTLSRNPYLTNLAISDAKRLTEVGVLALAHTPKLMSLKIDPFPSTLLSSHDHLLAAFACHPCLDRISDYFCSNETQASLALILVRNQQRREWWQRICCLIAFERANADSALHNSFVPFVESQSWTHPNNIFSDLLSLC